MQLSLFEEAAESKVTSFTDWLLVDGNNVMNRAFFIAEKKATELFLKMIIKFQRKYEANIIVFFDKGKGFRKDLLPEYKEGRKEKDPELELQFPIIRDLLSAANIPFFWDELLEADDLIACACNNLPNHKYILSNDKDLFQLIRDDVTPIVKRGKNDVLMTTKLFSEEWGGLKPSQIVDVKALAGDTSDNIKGISGIGDAGAIKIISHFGTVENITLPLPENLNRYKKKFSDFETVSKEMKFFKDIVTLRTTKPLNVIPYEIATHSLSNACKSLGMESIVELLEK